MTQSEGNSAAWIVTVGQLRVLRCLGDGVLNKRSFHDDDVNDGVLRRQQKVQRFAQEMDVVICMQFMETMP